MARVLIQFRLPPSYTPQKTTIMRFFSLAALVAVASAAAAARPSTLVHTVLFEFKPDADPAAVRAATARFLALKEKCVRPGTDVRYMLSMKGGSDNSPEGLQVQLHDQLNTP